MSSATVFTAPGKLRVAVMKATIIIGKCNSSREIAASSHCVGSSRAIVFRNDEGDKYHQPLR